LHYIKQKRDQQHILEVGCGNGWLAAQLASHTGNIVTGIDICSTAIEQAQRVFDTIPHLDFIPFDFNNEIFEEQKFDLVIIAASAGYFHSFKKMIAAAMEHLTLQGEIHILDSALYRQHEIAAVKEQAGKQLQAIDMNAIAPFYFYHSIDELKKYNHTVLYDPNSWMNRLMHQSNPFYHIIIKNRYQ
jgi:ubiquinone/menaquinone biosynthesis C-methylase UbiE